jgi:DnaJ-class molecular chaperone
VPEPLHIVECTHCGDRHFHEQPQGRVLFCPECAGLYRAAQDARAAFAKRKSFKAEKRLWGRCGVCGGSGRRIPDGRKCSPCKGTGRA